MFPIFFEFDITAVDVMWHMINNQRFVRIRPRDNYGYFYVKNGWIPACTFDQKNSWYWERGIGYAYRSSQDILKQPCVWSDVDFDLNELYGHPMVLGGNPIDCSVLDTLDEFLYVQFNKPLLTGEIWIPINDVLIQCPGRTICEFYYGGGEEYYQKVEEQKKANLESTSRPF